MPAQRPNRTAEILLRSGVIDEMQLRSAMAHVDRWGGRFVQVLVDSGLADEDRVVDTLARALRVERIRLENFVKHAQAPGIDANFAEEKVIFPAYFEHDGKVLVVAMADPMDLPTIDEIQRRTRARVVAQIASEREIKRAVARVFRSQKAVAEMPRPASTAMPAIAPADPWRSASQTGSTTRSPAVPLPPPPAGVLDATRPATRLADEDLERLRILQANQQKSGRIIRAVMALLIEKGYLTPQEVGGHYEPR
jgi:hypothetical protein